MPEFLSATPITEAKEGDLVTYQIPQWVRSEDGKRLVRVVAERIEQVYERSTLETKLRVLQKQIAEIDARQVDLDTEREMYEANVSDIEALLTKMEELGI